MMRRSSHRLLQTATLLALVTLFMFPAKAMSDSGMNGEKTMQSVDFEREFTIRKGKTVEFPDGFKLTFLGNSHKTVMAGGPSSPLIVVVAYELNGDRDQFNYSLYPDKNETWSWQGYFFYLVDYEYGSSMKLKVSHSTTMRAVEYDREFVIHTGETVKFPDGFKLTFNSLSSGDSSSSSVFDFNYEIDGEDEHNIIDLELSEDNSWDSEDLIFYVVDSMNGETVKLRVVDR